MDRETYYFWKSEIRALRREALLCDDAEIEAEAQEIEWHFPFNILARPVPRVRTLAERIEDQFGIPF